MTIRATRSEWVLAKVFGVISPKVRSKSVIAPVESATANGHSNRTTRSVASAEAPTFARVLPMIRLVRIRSGLRSQTRSG
jgi:hypothetical protein